MIDQSTIDEVKSFANKRRKLEAIKDSFYEIFSLVNERDCQTYEETINRIRDEINYLDKKITELS